jgi:hypothetical protein
MNGLVTIIVVLNGIASNFNFWSFKRVLQIFHSDPEIIFCLNETFF